MNATNAVDTAKLRLPRNELRLFSHQGLTMYSSIPSLRESKVEVVLIEVTLGNFL